MAEIEREAFSDPWPAQAFVDLLAQPHTRMMVASTDDDLVGYCVLLSVLDEGEIANIAVCRSARGRGVGARLLDEALAHATQQGIASVYLEVRVSNNPARGLYESRGFLPVGRRRAYYREPLEDALILRWERVIDGRSAIEK
jgi:[ribosomal protein S18]-alanine N-acetyltransferase